MKKALNLIASIIQVAGLTALILLLTDWFQVHPVISVTIIFIPLLKMALELGEEEEDYYLDDMDMIEINPNIMAGKPVIAGTRITVEAILEEMASGKTFADLVAAYPGLTVEQISAALLYAAKVLNDLHKAS